MIVFFWVLVCITAPLYAYTTSWQAVTYWIGVKCQNDPRVNVSLSHKGSPLEIQSIFTPKYQNLRNVIQIILLFLILGFGTYLKWYLGIVGAITVWIGSGVAALLIPKKVTYYLKCLSVDLQHKKADYKKENDIERAATALSLMVVIDSLYEYAENKGLTINDLDKENLSS